MRPPRRVPLSRAATVTGEAPPTTTPRGSSPFAPPARLVVHLCHAAAPCAPMPATAGRATPRQPRAPLELGPPLRTVGHRSELTTSHRRHLLPSLWPHRRCRPPSSTLRPGRHDHQLRPSLRDLDVHFNASFDPFSSLPSMTIPRPSAPSWGLNLSESSTAPSPPLFPRVGRNSRGSWAA
jgi:hypothetical protein